MLHRREGRVNVGGYRALARACKIASNVARRPNAEWCPERGRRFAVTIGVPRASVFARLPSLLFPLGCNFLPGTVGVRAGLRRLLRILPCRPSKCSVADITYVTLQLFVLQSGDLERPVGWKLDFARFAAPGGGGLRGLLRPAVALLFPLSSPALPPAADGRARYRLPAGPLAARSWCSNCACGKPCSCDRGG